MSIYDSIPNSPIYRGIYRGIYDTGGEPTPPPGFNFYQVELVGGITDFEVELAAGTVPYAVNLAD